MNELQNNYNALKERYTKLEHKNKDLTVDIEGLKAKKEVDLINIQRSKDSEVNSLNSELDKERQRLNDMYNEKLYLKKEIIEQTAEIDN